MLNKNKPSLDKFCFVNKVYRPYNKDMIAQIKGVIAAATERSVVVELGGVGYEVFVTRELATKMKPGKEVTLYTHFNVREDAQELFGFTESKDLSFYKLLLTVSGVGPRSALNIMDTARPDDIRQAVARDDAASLHRVHGIGKKTAERLVTELKDKVEMATSGGTVTSDDAALVEAITGLGYSLAEARRAVKETSGQGESLSDKIKFALKYLGRQ
ncbi:MAG TPA: Holliday junction branch migration protein RuvA [Candidatus Veblenbacteria bacterium]|nr:Holliday junction branch migration protein RuvA [Candidatus Veblenbacteria bacterium]HBT92098.1 Holliday junction branch migration protein RuvA [Candidatus Veblenbacteria bacterium]HCX38794.1 Holliday junction branch migration protein RuvA [Candidatus Veblenbacteria bacterium]